ncbi:glycine--tRNA ligase subunit beta [Yunchengibacter salinarum]|uniref:glycine--tRNA ligase subunit beta n=1 Tax=Yunchengibacter salinarum TaxID=3133399 RepID=UPI0035B58DEE
MNAQDKAETGELLIELYSEEIPAGMQQNAAAHLQSAMTGALADTGLTMADTRAFYTPQRLILTISGLPLKTPDISEEKRGPRVDAPEKAINGFLRGNGISRDQCVERDEKKGTFLYAVIEKQGEPTRDVIARKLAEIIHNFPWPKSQRWGSGSLRWVRPLHHALTLFNGDPVALPGLGVASGAARTRGHRFMAPDAFTVTGFADYAQKLRAAHVMLDPAERKRVIRDRALELADEAGVDLVDDPGLLDEVAGLVEWPVPLPGRFDPAFMTVPEEALIKTMKADQKYFVTRDRETGRLAPVFITVANIEAPDGGDTIIRGNERVLAARLSDARFFWEQDLKTPLEDLKPRLADIVFHEKLGQLSDRVDRMVALSGHLADHIPGCHKQQAERAASLAKADLVTGMVGEFADLQGIMGRYYALAQNEDAAVADAILDHYAPRGPKDRCPTAPISVAVALAEKLDTLVGFFGIGETPTGSKDPFALRRAALGVIRLITENGLRVSLTTLFHTARGLYAADRIADADDTLTGFVIDRLKVQQRERGVRHDVIDAATGGQDDLVRLLALVDALQGFLDTDDGANLLAGYKRAANILKAEARKDGAASTAHVDPVLFQEDFEKALYDALGTARKAAETALEREDFAAAMRALANLRKPIDSFFDGVTVNADDSAVRQNRLALLTAIQAATDAVADFSQLEG